MSKIMPVKCTVCGKEQIATTPMNMTDEEALKDAKCVECENIGTLKHIGFG